MTATGQFTPNPEMTAIAIAYRNPAYALIHKQVLPEKPVGRREFKYKVYAAAANFTVPDTRVGPRSQPRQLEIEGSEMPAFIADYGIDVPLDNPTIKEAEAAGFDPRNQAMELASDVVQLDREVRVAALVTNPANYHADHKLDITDAADRIGGANAKPYTLLMDMLSDCWMRPNQIVMGRAVWNLLENDPQMVKKVGGASAEGKKITPADVAKVLEINTVLVGEGRVNINRPGQAAELHYVWRNVIAGHFINPAASPMTGGVTWGFTAVHGTPIGGSMPANIGVHGGELIRSAESVKELVVADRVGFLVTNAITEA